MKKTIILSVLILLAVVLPGFSQIASIRFAESFPELCIWSYNLPLVQAEGAVAARVHHWRESPMEGRYYAGYTDYFYEGVVLVGKESMDDNGNMLSAVYFTYEDNWLLESIMDRRDWDYYMVTQYYHYDDRTEVFSFQRSKKPASGKPSETAPKLYKTIWYDSSDNFTKIETPSAVKTYEYKNGFLTKAKESPGREILYTYTEEALLESINVEGEYSLFITYKPNGTVSGITLNTMYQTTVYGNLEVETNSRGDLVWIGPTEIEWFYK